MKQHVTDIQLFSHSNTNLHKSSYLWYTDSACTSQRTQFAAMRTVQCFIVWGTMVLHWKSKYDCNCSSSDKHGNTNMLANTNGMLLQIHSSSTSWAIPHPNTFWWKQNNYSVKQATLPNAQPFLLPQSLLTPIMPS